MAVDGAAVDGVRYVAGMKDGEYTFAAVNFSDTDRVLDVAFPEGVEDAQMYLYQEGNLLYDGEYPAPVKTGVKGKRVSVKLPAQTFVLLTEMK